jgi:thiamine biosynthesis lipoprotein
MRHARIIMGMPISVDIVNVAPPETFEKVFEYFTWVDNTFSTYKTTSEVSRINAGTLLLQDASAEVQEVFRLSEETKELTNGFFDIQTGNLLDPSGLVKGWSIYNAATILRKDGYHNFFIEAGGDIQTSGTNHDGQPWRVGIKNPRDKSFLSKIVGLTGNRGIATSGTYERGQHIYNPKTGEPITDIISLTIIGPNIYEADRFTTAAFAMGDAALPFMESLDDMEGSVIFANGEEKETSGFKSFIV